MKTLAYLDAGTGSIMLQALLGGVAGAVVVLKLFGRRMLRVLTFWKKRPAQPATAAEPPEGERTTVTANDKAV